MRLRQIMDARGINQVELAARSGVAQNLISSYLRRSKQAQYPSLKSLIALARALHCTVDELLGISESHDVGKPEPPMSDKVRRIVQFLETLEDTDPLKDYLIKLIAAKSDSHET